jgi:hypothetical protein
MSLLAGIVVASFQNPLRTRRRRKATTIASSSRVRTVEWGSFGPIGVDRGRPLATTEAARNSGYRS